MLLLNLAVKAASEKIVMAVAPNTQRLSNLYVLIQGGDDVSRDAGTKDFAGQLHRTKLLFGLWINTYGFVDPRNQNEAQLKTTEDKILSGQTGNVNVTDVLAQVMLAMLCNQTFPHPAISTFLSGDCIYVSNPATSRTYANFANLGSGSFGRVLSAECTNYQDFQDQGIRTPHLVAIKEINTARLASRDIELSTFESRLKREITNFRCIQHKSVVSFIDYISIQPTEGHPLDCSTASCYAGSRMYLVMERCPGEELFNYILEDRITRPEITAALAQVGRALLYLHSCQIIHRDIKPENIGYFHNKDTGEVVCKLFDFGLSKKIGETPSQMGVTKDAGTENYRAPEVAEGSLHDFKVDVYSLGITIALCTGKEFPVNGNSGEIDWGYCVRITQRGRKVVPDTDYGDLPATWTRTPQDMKDLVSLMTSKNPAERITLAQAMSHPYWGEHAITAAELAEIEASGAATVAQMEASSPVQDLF